MFKKGNSKRWKALSLAVALYLGGGDNCHLIMFVRRM